MAAIVHGACACGRNRQVSQEATEDCVWQYYLEADPIARRDGWTANLYNQDKHQTSPFTAWLRVPLEWYRSATFALYPDETSRSIRRTFESPYASHTRRQFCGYCGTQLSSWTERTREDADFISLTLGSIFDEDLDILDQHGILGLNVEESDEDDHEVEDTTVVRHQPVQDVVARGQPWFEDMVHNTRFGRVKRKRGGHSTADGSVQVEWEVVEYTEGDEEEEEGPRATKRKITDFERDSGDVEMRSG